jgi:hypothetical protein
MLVFAPSLVGRGRGEVSKNMSFYVLRIKKVHTFDTLYKK